MVHMFVAVGNISGTATTTTVFGYSYDGINWLGGITSPSITVGKCVAWNGSLFVAGGY